MACSSQKSKLSCETYSGPPSDWNWHTLSTPKVPMKATYTRKASRRVDDVRSTQNTASSTLENSSMKMTMYRQPSK